MSEIIIYSTGMLLLHSLWQLTIVFLVFRILLFVLKNGYPTVRYKLAGGALFFSLAAAILTFMHYFLKESSALNSVGIHFHSTQQLMLAGDVLDNHMPEGSEKGFAALLLPYIVPVYVSIVFILVLRLLISVLYLKKYRVNGILEPDQNLQNLFHSLSKKLELKKKVILLESTITKIPLALGYLKPAIIIPAGIFFQMPLAQVEAILAHELAHVRRNDFLLNLIQSLIEILFFYHPAIYLISKYIREERENCCDDIAIGCCSDPAQYAKALAGMNGIYPLPSYPAVAFVKSKNLLLNRIKRILKPNNMKTRISDRIAAAIIIAAGFFTLVIASAATLHNISGEYSEPIESSSIQYLISDDHSPAIFTPADSVIDFDKNKIITTGKNSQGEEENTEITFNNGKIAEIKVNGRIIPEEEFSDYQEIIENTLEEVRKAGREVEIAGEKLEAIDIDEINAKIEDALREARQVDQERLNSEVERAREELEKIDNERIKEETERAVAEAHREIERTRTENIHPDSLADEIARAMESINWEEIRVSVAEALAEVKMSEEDIKRAMNEAKQAMEEINWGEIQESVYLGLDAARMSMESIDWDFLRESLEFSLDISSDVLDDISAELKGAFRDLEEIDISKEIESAKADVKEEKRNLEELEKNMEQALEELEKK